MGAVDIEHNTTDEGLSYGPKSISEGSIFTAWEVGILC